MYKSKLIKALDVLDKDYREAILNEDNDLILAIQNQQSAYMIALRLLDNEPTAYDIGKVVEELEKIQDKAVSVKNEDISIYATGMMGKAIEIVKHGGVSDDVCDWKKSKDYPFDWLVGCDGCEVNHKQGDYCPRCGNKIKVVE